MITVLKENGYPQALYGLSLSYKTLDFDRVKDVAYKLAGKGGGHDKFLESIIVWLSITAPRYIWQEFDTYRVGITKQSESTIHTLNKTVINRDLFDEMELEENDKDFYVIIKALERIHSRGNLHDTKIALPEGFLQNRIVCTNYKTIQNIYRQRKNHKMKWWETNLDLLLNQLEHPELITKDNT